MFNKNVNVCDTTKQGLGIINALPCVFLCVFKGKKHGFLSSPSSNQTFVPSKTSHIIITLDGNMWTMM